MLAGRERAVAEVDLEAIRHNVRRFHRDLAPGAAILAVVKADAYGHGAVPVARAALEAGARWLGVACVGEAEELRAAGITAPILILGPLTGAELARVAAAGAEAVVWSAPFLAEARRCGVRVHVKFDSGMGRLGVNEGEARELCASASAAGLLGGLMSHFATADEADTTFFAYQLGRFTALARELRPAYPDLLCHTANSAAALRGGHTHFDMIRIGIAMYGLAPANDDPFKDGLRPAMKLKSYVADVREVRAGDSVGYGRRFIAGGPSRIGIVPIGYADGVRRRLGNRGEVLVADRRCPIVGTVSMDQLTVLLPGGWGGPGDEVVFFGAAGEGEPCILCEEVAQLLETINYEVVCDVSARVARRYRGVAPGE